MSSLGEFSEFQLKISPKNIVTSINTNSKLLSLIKIPNIQREIDENHLQELITYQELHYKKYGCFSFPRPLIICYIESTNDYYIIDGQHRLYAIQYFIKKNYNNFKILISFIKCSKKELDEQFVIINKNKNMIMHKNYSQQQFINSFRKYMQKMYSIYLKSSKKPQIPHINLDIIDEYIKEYEVINRLPAKICVNQFINEIEKLNVYIENNYKSLFFQPSLKKKYEKCKKNNCNNYLYLRLLGERFEWIEMIIAKMTQNTSYQKIIDRKCKNSCSIRSKIPKRLRMEVWNKRNSKLLIGLCYVCEKELKYEDFHCGHIVSVFNGGENQLSNLEPICKTCNNDMSVMNLNEYKKILHNMQKN